MSNSETPDTAPTYSAAHASGPVPPPRQPTVERSASQRTQTQPRVPPPDVVSYFDPASAGGGGPLRRISTQQKERSEAEARERAAREAAGLPKDEGLLSRFRSSSFHRPRPIGPLAPVGTVPLISESHNERSLSRDRHREGENEIETPGLSSAWSSKTLAALSDGHGHEEEKNAFSRRPSTAVGDADAHEAEMQAMYPDGGYGWVVLCCCISLAGLTMGWVGYSLAAMDYTLIQQGMTIGVILAVRS